MGYEMAWLHYHKISEKDFLRFLTAIHVEYEDSIIQSAAEEITSAVKDMFGIYLPYEKGESREGILLKLSKKDELGKEGYHIYPSGKAFVIEANSSSGILYGAFQMIRLLQCGYREENMEEIKVPDNPLRMINHWDNMDGSIERGYSGKSFFFQDNEIIVDKRIKDYARLAASVGINGVVLNNVNVKNHATELISKKYFKQLKEIQRIFASYGIKLYLSLNFAAPIELGNLNSADPLSIEVKNWWKDKLNEVYQELPGFGGFLIKADSEGRPGPFTYGRTHADGANMLAEIIEPHGGIIIWRCFVYNCEQDWRDKKTDRARAGYDHFKPLDGTFAGNVILQIKNGPMDFQVREPVSPLFGGMKQTNQMLEVQIAQEYTGQQRHVCYLIPMFKEVLNFRTYCENNRDKVSDIVSGKTYGWANCGMAAVANTGDDDNWFGHDLAAANFYGFGRLSFDIGLSSEEIAGEWIAMTFGTHPKVQKNIRDILMISWPAYENYTSPLGIGWMVNPHSHYGPNVDGYEYDRWGTYHRADHFGLGVDRSTKGTGYAAQYHNPNALNYETVENCPEDLLLFFHYVKYTHRLTNGKTLIQHIYDAHFEGVEEVEVMLKMWIELIDYIEDSVYQRVLKRLEYQLEHSKEWRDIICSYFYRKSAITDDKNREIF